MQVAQHVSERPAARVINPDGVHNIVLICEHASNHIPEEFDSLGLGEEALASHIAWDPGALAIAEALSEKLDAALVHSTISRLVYDCNRPPDAIGAMPEQSEATLIPGNKGLSLFRKEARVEAYYRPFETLVSNVLNERNEETVIVTIHSFTPHFLGEKRAVEVGILHDQDARLADVVLSIASGYVIERNQPYGPRDGVTHTLKHHALPRNLLNVMVEIRNDLIATPEQVAVMASRLADWLTEALSMLQTPSPQEAAK